MCFGGDDAGGSCRGWEGRETERVEMFYLFVLYLILFLKSLDVFLVTAMCSVSSGQPSACGGEHGQPGHASIRKFPTRSPLFGEICSLHCAEEMFF